MTDSPARVPARDDGASVRLSRRRRIVRGFILVDVAPTAGMAGLVVRGGGVGEGVSEGGAHGPVRKTGHHRGIARRVGAIVLAGGGVAIGVSDGYVDPGRRVGDPAEFFEVVLPAAAEPEAFLGFPRLEGVRAGHGAHAALRRSAAWVSLSMRIPDQ